MQISQWELRDEWKQRRITILQAIRCHVSTLRLVIRNAEVLLASSLLPPVIDQVLAENIPAEGDPFDGRYDRRLRMAAEIGLATMIGLRPRFAAKPETMAIAGDIADFVEQLTSQLDFLRGKLSQHYRNGVRIFGDVRAN